MMKKKAHLQKRKFLGNRNFIISFIDQPDVIKKILQHLGLWGESHAPPGRDPPVKEITFDPSYGSINSPSRGRSRDSQVI